MKTQDDVAEFFDIDYNRLKYYLYIIPPTKSYKQFTLQKKTGGVRIISAPISPIKILQTKLNDVLYELYTPGPCVKGYRKGESIYHNAILHTKRRYVLNVDLSDFFTTINFGRVRGLFMSSLFSFNDTIATILAQISCYAGVLPQGAPTSPIISNMICYRMDKALREFAKSCNLQYSRYADDLTFSTYLHNFPTQAAYYDDEKKLVLGNHLLETINNSGFSINSKKIRLQNKYNRQEVTGLIVNKQVNVKRRYIRQIRAILHAWKEYGYDAAEQEHLNIYYKKQINLVIPHPNLTLINILKGKLSFISAIKGVDNSVYTGLIRKAHELCPDQFKLPQNELDKLYKTYIELYDLKYEGKKITAHERGYYLEVLFKRLFDYFKFSVKQGFTRNASGEQIDGAFKFNNWHYLVECKWHKKLTDIRQLDNLYGKISRAGNQTMGCFISIKGWSKPVIPVLKQNPSKSIILFNGADLEYVLQQKISLNELIEKKEEALNYHAEPYYNPFL